MTRWKDFRRITRWPTSFKISGKSNTARDQSSKACRIWKLHFWWFLMRYENDLSKINSFQFSEQWGRLHHRPQAMLNWHSVRFWTRFWIFLVDACSIMIKVVKYGWYVRQWSRTMNLEVIYVPSLHNKKL